MKTLTALLLAFSLLPTTAFTQQVNTAKLDSFFNSLAEHDLAMGSLAVSVKGKIQYQRSIGYADIKNNKLANANTKYRVGSVSKLFTAILIFQLVDQKKIRLDQMVSSYFPSIPNGDKITIGNLLNHRSGIHDYTKGTDFYTWMYQPKTHEELLTIIANGGTDFAPGTKTEYNNSNYLLLSYIVERVCKTTYAEALRQRIVSKIGLINTYYGKPISINDNESFSYAYNNGQWSKDKETDMSIHGGAGSVVSTPTDLTKLLDVLFANKLVSTSSLNQMKTLTMGFGYGFQIWLFQSNSGYGKGGEIENFISNAYYFPEQKMSVVYCTNGFVYPMADIYDEVLNICFNNTDSGTQFKSITLNPKELNKYIGKYTAYQMPIIVTCAANNGQLLMQTKGQTFALDAIGNNHFMNKQSGYFFEFIPEKDQLIIKEKKNVYYLRRDK